MLLYIYFIIFVACCCFWKVINCSGFLPHDELCVIWTVDYMYMYTVVHVSHKTRSSSQDGLQTFFVVLVWVSSWQSLGPVLVSIGLDWPWWNTVIYLCEDYKKMTNPRTIGDRVVFCSILSIYGQSWYKHNHNEGLVLGLKKQHWWLTDS